MSNVSHIGPKREFDAAQPRFESLAHMFRAAVHAEPDRAAVIWGERQIDYRDFGRAVNGLCARLRPTLGAGGRAVLMMPNSIEMDIALMAVMTVGAQVAPVNPFFKPAELRKVLAGLDASLIICDASTRATAEAMAAELDVNQVICLDTDGSDIAAWIADEALDAEPESQPGKDDLALLIFTGGSTGTPKGVDHTHSGLMASLRQHCTVWPLEMGKETFLNVAPMFHIWGLAYATWVPIYTCGTLVMVPKYEPDKVVEALDRYRVTVFGGGPAPIYMGLLASPVFDSADLSQMRYCLSGGAPCPEDLHHEWLRRTGQPLLEGWGMSEGAPFCLNPLDGQRKLLSVGNPVPGTEIEIVDLETSTEILPLGESGEVRARGPQNMLGYRNNPEETQRTLRDGWIYTGDIGYVDEDGFLFLVDRKKDMVLVGGYNVYPREIDEVLFNHPLIREAAAVGKPDARLGEVVVAFVVLNQGAQLSEDEFFAYCKDAMVKYKRPVEVFFVDALPKTGTNKINRLELRARLRGQSA
jgi:long-chain acyl-CoA synthetase